MRATNYDTLTNLPNQVLFKDRVQHVLALTRRHEQALAVILLNLDKFKVINDTLGFQSGDQVLQEVAQRLTSCVRESDTVARFGSDEFAVLLTQISRAEDAAIVAENIKVSLDRPFNLNGQDYFITSRMGISLHPYDGKDTLSLLKSAATALSRAKEHANGYEFYTPGRTTKALKQLLLQNNLRAGLERNEFVIHYQPQVNTETAQVVAMEALVRWQHPGLGLLYPGEFISLAEDNGLIGLLSEWVLRNACRQNKCWQDAGFDPLRVAVNLSALQFQQPKSIETIARVLDETGLDPHFLELELTEGSIMKNPEQAIKKLHEFKAMGVRISIDDFGTGYSSLNYLKRFPIDTLKIDQCFVREITSDAADAAIVKAIITLAHALKLNVIAEGVETSDQFESLQMLKCDEVQGFLFSKPLSTEEFTQLLSEKRRHDSPRDYATTRLPSLPNEFARS
jgi:diguanylate cyclase (GGDEF)-like protein